MILSILFEIVPTTRYYCFLCSIKSYSLSFLCSLPINPNFGFWVLPTMVSIKHHRHLLGTDTDIPPTTGGGRVDHPFTTKDQNFDSNMVIILAALLCALICALGLNSIIRCALRCGLFRLGLDGGAGSTAGLNKAALRKIPVEEYSGVEAAECPICLAEFAEGEKVRVLPKCNHGFHVKCVDKWLVSHSSCPTCRQQLSLLEQPNPTNNNNSTTSSTSNLEQGHY